MKRLYEAALNEPLWPVREPDATAKSLLLLLLLEGSAMGCALAAAMAWW